MLISIALCVFFSIWATAFILYGMLKTKYKKEIMLYWMWKYLEQCLNYINCKQVFNDCYYSAYAQVYIRYVLQNINNSQVYLDVPYEDSFWQNYENNLYFTAKWTAPHCSLRLLNRNPRTICSHETLISLESFTI